MEKVLVVDDNPNIISFVQQALERQGYAVTTARDGLEALYQVEMAHPDLIILDIEVPAPDGLEVCRQLRERGDETPIIFLTVRDSITDLELGFEFGADDYVTKPFDVRELLARVKARLPPRSLEIDGYLRLDVGRRKVWARGEEAWQEVSLTPKEFDLLRYLVYNAGRAIGKTTLLEQVFEYPDDVETKTVEKHIWSLRQKLEPDAKKPRYILNVRGLGYKFEE
ncbi:MAG: response regulator transcription factor [Anaerolineae bacterium]|jgi:two-component system alkaline phosphatase synthesis response regulator PhoP